MEYKYIDPQILAQRIGQPDWYVELLPKYQQLKTELEKVSPDTVREMVREVYSFFEDAIAENQVYLGDEVGIWDAERKPIDTIVIHHTKNKPGMTRERLSVMELLRLYAPYYAQPNEKKDAGLKGKPISSGHIRDGQQVFYPYHWIVRTDGTAERLLYDEETGWQAGDWEVNCRSVAIVFDNNYESSTPPELELETVARIIRENYSYVSKERVFGHCEVRTKGPTTCPSALFLSTEHHRGWKEDLVARL